MPCDVIERAFDSGIRRDVGSFAHAMRIEPRPSKFLADVRTGPTRLPRLFASALGIVGVPALPEGDVSRQVELRAVCAFVSRLDGAGADLRTFASEGRLLCFPPRSPGRLSS